MRELDNRLMRHIDLLVERYPSLESAKNDIVAAYLLLEESYENGGKLLVAGNGGSAADAEHIVGELMKGFKLPRKPETDFAEKLVEEIRSLVLFWQKSLQGALPAIALDGHPALSTAYMNDCEPLLCFAQQVNGYGKSGDVFLGISTSGNSKNVLYAATTAHAKGMKVIGLTGAKDSKLKDMSDVCIKAPQTETYMIQELHLPIYHCLCLMLEDKLFCVIMTKPCSKHGNAIRKCCLYVADGRQRDSLPAKAYDCQFTLWMREKTIMGKYFGTDGFRGEAGITLTADHAYKVGRFLGWYYNVLRERNGNNEPARIVIGKDTRRSSYMFEYSLVAGLTASGADAYLLHVTTTPSVAYIARVDDFDCGIMISASHNPYYDNGIKLIDCYGEKMPEEILLLVEDYIDGKLHVFDKDWPELPFAHREHIGCTVDYVAGRNRYMGYLISLGIYSFKGVKVGLDCANGSSWNIAKSVFDALGADTYIINNKPNGLNINNNAGSTHIEGLQKFVVEKGLDIGFAYDGDADRCLCVDEKGNVITGDHILYIYSCYMKERGKLLTNTVVTTVMFQLWPV